MTILKILTIGHPPLPREARSNRQRPPHFVVTEVGRSKYGNTVLTQPYLSHLDFISS